VEVELEAGTTGAELIELLAVNNEEVEKLQSVIRLAVNDDYIDPTSLLSDGDDIAVITPVSGG
ncbi:MAG: MoaD/ThiS family protein, partial [Bacteroidetes Order II. Incertae sedis bacterium]|nr:MoaD/ThiS family protein [Bacteroidetes Order II. bacterium]